MPEETTDDALGPLLRALTNAGCIMLHSCVSCACVHFSVPGLEGMRRVAEMVRRAQARLPKDVVLDFGLAWEEDGTVSWDLKAQPERPAMHLFVNVVRNDEWEEATPDVLLRVGLEMNGRRRLALVR